MTLGERDRLRRRRPHGLHGILPAFVVGLLLLAASMPAAAQESASSPLLREWAIHAGAFDIGTNDTTGEVGVEARFRLYRMPLGSFELPLEPQVGAMANGDSGGYVYAGFRVPLEEVWPEALPERWRVVPFAAVGLYEEGDGKDLGGPVEFRSGVEVSYRLSGSAWLGLTLYHLSNAVLYDENPGEESLVVTLSWR